MNYRVRLFPVPRIRGLRTPLPRNEDLRFPPVEWGNTRLFRSWAVYEFDFEPSRLNGNSLLGLALAFGVGAGFWTAAGLLIARLW
jgi:hypothetical protein